MKSIRLLTVVALCLAASAFSSAWAGNPTLGLVAKSVSGHIGNAEAAEGASIYSGDYLTTEAGGTLLVRFGPLSIELQGSSAAHIYEAPYGAIVELNRGTVIYTTPGGRQNLVIVASDVRVTPVLSLSSLGRVTIDDPCDVTVFSQRGEANVQVGSESRFVEEGKAYRVRAESELTYREYLSPDASDYHNYHTHKPCAPPAAPQGHSPIAAAHSRFLLVTAALVGTAAGIATWKALESNSHP